MLLNEDYLLQQLVLIFHAYYQTKRFLNRLIVPLSNDPFFNSENNYYDPVAHMALCSELNIFKNDSFTIKISQLMPIEILLKKLP